MGQLSKPHLIEAAIWSLIVAVFFGYSFEFNQPIEIYKFGATGWPRVIILLSADRHGSAICITSSGTARPYRKAVSGSPRPTIPRLIIAIRRR